MTADLQASTAWRGRRPFHQGEIWALTTVIGSDGSAIVVSGGSDGRLRRWDPVTGSAVGADMSGHSNKVWALAVAKGSDGAAVLVSGSDDGTIRRWDPITGRAVGDPLVGGTRAVRALATLHGPRDTTVVVSGGDDGALRLWDPVKGELIWETSSPVGRVWALAAVERPGRPAVLVVGGNSGLCVWEDPVGMGPVGDVLAGHQGGVRALAAGPGPGGTAAVFSGGEDNGVRWWDLDSRDSTGAPVGQPLGYHGSWVRSLAVVPGSGHASVLVSGGDDWRIRRWDSVTGAPVGDPFTLRSTTTALTTVPGPGGSVLAVSGGGDGELRLWSVGSQAGYPTRDDAISAQDSPTVDDALGREVLATYLDQYLAEAVTTAPHGSAVIHLDGRWGSGKSSLLELALHPDRAGLRTPPRRHLVEPIVVRYDAWRESAIAPEWWSLAVGVQRTVRGALPWPTRWALSITDTTARLLKSRSVTFAGIAWVLLIMAPWLFGPSSWPARVDTAVSVLTAVAGAGTLLTTLGGALFWTAPALGRLRLRSDDNPLEEIAIMVSRLRRWSPPVGEVNWPTNAVASAWLFTAVAVSALSPLRDAWSVSPVARWALAGWSVALVGVTVGLATRALRRRLLPRRPILVLIDDLDRCEPERVVGLVETVHTLLRDDPRRGHVTPAAMLVVMAADGRWVRQSFEEHYGAFKSLGDDTHSLGADFVQKIFDHTVLVPELTTDQSAELLRVITDDSGASETPRPAGRAGPAGPDGRRADPSAQSAEDQSLSAAAVAFQQRTEELRTEAELEATSAKQEQRASDLHHRLADADWAALMPRNPRLIKRVANAWGMLRVVAVRREGRPDEDLLVRAAILLVRFPSLVDELVTAVEPSRFVRPAEDSPWLRQDVQAIIAGVDPVDLALCYGHHLMSGVRT